MTQSLKYEVYIPCVSQSSDPIRRQGLGVQNLEKKGGGKGGRTKAGLQHHNDVPGREQMAAGGDNSRVENRE